MLWDYGNIVNYCYLKCFENYFENVNVVYGGELDEFCLVMVFIFVLELLLDSLLMKEEIFGFILFIIIVDNMEVGIKFVNSRFKLFVFYVFSDKDDVFDNIISKISLGSVCINDIMLFMINFELLFGGVGNSGMGSYYG